MELLKLKPLLKKRNSEFGDMFLVMVMIFAIAIFIIILAYAYSQVEPRINTALESAHEVEASSNVTQVLSQSSTALTRINVLFPLLIVGLFGFVFISAFFIKSHPAFFFIGLIILGVALILAAVFSNVYKNITENETFADTEDDYNILTLFIENMPLIILLVFIAMGVIMWVRGTGGGGM